MFCRKCCESLPNDTVFCPYCGMKIVTPSLTNSNTQIDKAAKEDNTNTLPLIHEQDNTIINNKDTGKENVTQESKNEFGLVAYFIFCIVSVVISATIAGPVLIMVLLFGCGSAGLTLTKSLWKTNKIKSAVALLVGLISVCIMMVAMAVKHDRRRNL